MSKACYECGKCGKRYAVGAKHECGATDALPPTAESLQKQINFMAKVLKDQDTRLNELEARSKCLN